MSLFNHLVGELHGWGRNAFHLLTETRFMLAPETRSTSTPRVKAFRARGAGCGCCLCF
jgi:hypothetical protein